MIETTKRMEGDKSVDQITLELDGLSSHIRNLLAHASSEIDAKSTEEIKVIENAKHIFQLTKHTLL